MNRNDRYDSLFQIYSHWTRMGDTWTERPMPVDWTLLKRQAHAESDFNPRILSPGKTSIPGSNTGK